MYLELTLASTTIASLKKSSAASNNYCKSEKEFRVCACVLGSLPIIFFYL
jgi:hypothetical protein